MPIPKHEPIGQTKIQNPHAPNDYILIPAKDFVEGAPLPVHGIKSMQLFTGAPKPAAARPTGDPPPPDKKGQSADSLKRLRMEDLGPAISEVDDKEVLVRFMEIEKRKTAQALARARLNELE